MIGNDDSIEVPDLMTLVELVERDRVGVYWSVLSEIGPGWIGSRRELTFFVDGTPVAENELTRRLANTLIDGLTIPATSKDHLITGEGDLRRKGKLIEVLYDWNKGIPYDDPTEAGSGVFTLLEIEDA